MKNGTCNIKNTFTKEQVTVSLDDFANTIKKGVATCFNNSNAAGSA